MQLRECDPLHEVGAVTRRPAAFFDLDRTLMAGSSAFQFGRAAYRAGLMSRRQLARSAWASIRFRLEGSTDARADALRERIGARHRGSAGARSPAAGALVLAGILPRFYPPDARGC